MKPSISRTLLITTSLCLCTGFAAAQGANSCSNAQLIAGTGTFDFATTSATTDGQEEGWMPAPGLRQIENDVWFRWIAPKTSIYEISTDYWPTTDGATVVAIYRYGCASGPGRAIASRGLNPGSLFTTYDFGTVEGVEYLIRIGNTVDLNHTNGIFSLTEVSPPAILATGVYAGNGRSYHFLEPSNWSTAQAAAVLLGGNLVTVNDQAEQDWLQQTFHNWGGQARSFWLGYNDAETEGTWVWASGESPGYTNWTNPPNNGNDYEHYAHFRSDIADGTWNDLIGHPKEGFFYGEVHGVVETLAYDPGIFCVGDGSGTPCPCGNNAGLLTHAPRFMQPSAHGSAGKRRVGLAPWSVSIAAPVKALHTL